MPPENLDLYERMGFILLCYSLSRRSVFLRHSSPLCLRSCVHTLPLSWRTWPSDTKSACCLRVQVIQREIGELPAIVSGVGGPVGSTRTPTRAPVERSSVALRNGCPLRVRATHLSWSAPSARVRPALDCLTTAQLRAQEGRIRTTVKMNRFYDLRGIAHCNKP